VDLNILNRHTDHHKEATTTKAPLCNTPHSNTSNNLLPHELAVVAAAASAVFSLRFAVAVSPKKDAKHALTAPTALRDAARYPFFHQWFTRKRQNGNLMWYQLKIK